MKAEVDTGSNCLILESRFMNDCGLQRDDDVETVRGTDESGYEYTRRFAQVRGTVRLREAPATTRDGPRVMFQEIVHDALLGTDFLNRFVHTFDVPNNRLVLRAPGLSI